MRRAMLFPAMLAALAFAGTGFAAGGQNTVSGFADQTLFAGTPDQEHDQYSVGAVSDADGSNPRGAIEYTSDAAGLPQSHFHGDVSQGCVIVGRQPRRGRRHAPAV